MAEHPAGTPSTQAEGRHTKLPLLLISVLTILALPPLAPCGRASDWMSISNSPQVSVEFDNRILRSNSYQIETWIRISFYGERRFIRDLGARAGSVQMASIFNCRDRTVVTRLARYYEQPAGIGEIACQQPRPGTPLPVEAMDNDPLLQAVAQRLCGDPSLRNRPTPQPSGTLHCLPGYDPRQCCTWVSGTLACERRSEAERRSRDDSMVAEMAFQRSTGR